MNVKVSATAHSVADMITQNTAVTSTQMDGILAAASAIMAPYPTKNGSTSLMTITVSEVSTDANGKATVQWSKSTNSSGARTVGQQMTLSSFTAPSGTSNANISLILSEVSYDYTPNLGFTIAGTVKLSDSYYLFPRCSTNSPTRLELSLLRREVSGDGDLLLHPASAAEELLVSSQRAGRSHPAFARAEARLGCRGDHRQNRIHEHRSPQGQVRVYARQRSRGIAAPGRATDFNGRVDFIKRSV